MNLPFTVRQKGALRSGQIDRKEGTVVKILNFGSLNLDKVYKVAHFVREGETISAQEQNQFLGGKGLNQSVALARAGIFVEHAGAVGRETTEFHALLKAEGAGTTYLRVLETVSGHAVIQSCAGQNCIIVYGGANRMTRPQDVDAFLKDYGPGDLLLLQNETSCVRYAMEQAREKGMTVAFNPSPIDGSLTQDVLALADVLFVNETEGGLLSGTPANENEAVLTALAERFPHVAVVLTVGGEGALYRKGGVLLRQRAYPVKAVDTTAAGDTFTGYFLAGMIRGFDPGKCLRCASMAAALAVSREGASASIPTWREVLDFSAAQGGTAGELTGNRSRGALTGIGTARPWKKGLPETPPDDGRKRRMA